MTSPEMQPPTIEGGDGSLQKESITLPDEQTITVRGEKETRTLRLLITAFNQDKPYVLNEDLLRDISKGIPLRLNTRKPPYKAVHSLNHKLTGTGWSIQSITVAQNGIERKPKGYVLKKEVHKVDTLTSYLQSIFHNKTVITELVTNKPGKTSILEEAKQQINSRDLQEKVIFLGKIFVILSDPDTQSQNQRDAALDLLRVTDLTDVDPEKLKKTYAKAVSSLRENLTQDSDPYGEIHMLLEAGKTIAPFIANRQGIMQSWNHVAKAFTGDDRQKILDDIEEVRQLIPNRFSELDTNVEILINQGLRNQDIATKLHVTLTEIRGSVRRLNKRGVRFSRETGRIRTKQREQLFKDVKDLRMKGMSNLEIAKRLTIPRETINNIASELLRKGEIPSIYTNLEKGDSF